MNTRKIIGYGLMAVIIALAFTACDTGGGGGGGGSPSTSHTHSYSATWSYNATQHWHECSCGDKTGVANHSWNTDTGLCNTNCGALYYDIGDTGPGGGKIFFRSAVGFTVQMVNPVENYTAHYLEAAPTEPPDQYNLSARLWSSTLDTPANIQGTSTAIGTGRKNTALILATDAQAPAALTCKNYSNGGKTDWFLPSKDELNELCMNRNIFNNWLTTGSSGYYLSSSQYQPVNVNGYNFSTGVFHAAVGKNDNSGVRAVRAF
jgi:hypothetical protein